MNAQNLKMESGAGEWMQTRFSFLFVDEMNQTRQQVVSYINSLWVFNLWWTKNTKMQKQFFFFIYKWKNKCKQDEWCKDRMDLIQELKLWYQMLQAGNQGWQNGWWKLDGSIKDMIGWAIGWNASYDPENKCKNKWDMISNMIKQDK